MTKNLNIFVINKYMKYVHDYNNDDYSKLGIINEFNKYMYKSKRIFKFYWLYIKISNY